MLLWRPTYQSADRQTSFNNSQMIFNLTPPTPLFHLWLKYFKVKDSVYINWYTQVLYTQGIADKYKWYRCDINRHWLIWIIINKVYLSPLLWIILLFTSKSLALGDELSRPLKKALQRPLYSLRTMSHSEVRPAPYGWWFTAGLHLSREEKSTATTLKLGAPPLRAMTMFSLCSKRKCTACTGNSLLNKSI